MGAITTRGLQAQVRWGYQVAAEIGDWSFTGTRRAGGTVLATVRSRHEFRLAQRPLTFAWSASLGRRERWPISAVVETAQGVTLTIAPWGKDPDE